VLGNKARAPHLPNSDPVRLSQGSPEMDCACLQSIVYTGPMKPKGI